MLYLEQYDGNERDCMDNGVLEYEDYNVLFKILRCICNSA